MANHKDKDQRAEVNINIRVPLAKRTAFQKYCAENEVKGGMSGSIIEHIDKCIAGKIEGKK